MSVIRLTELAKSYGTTRALAGATVEIPRGAVGLLGPNGAGKTTLLKCLLGLLHPDSGRAEVLGLDPVVSPLPLRARIGYMPEADCWIPGLSGVRFVALAGELAGLDRRSALTRAHEVLHYVGLDEARYRIADDYSQGMRQRLRLAQAIVHDPDLLFLDEPTSGMDPGGRTEMLTLVADLATRHEKHVLVSTHLLGDVEEVCSHVVVMREGKIVASGPIETLLASEGGLYEARVTTGAAALAERLTAAGHEAQELPGERVSVRLPDGTRPLFEAARASDTPIRELRERTATLEEAFLKALAGGEAT